MITKAQLLASMRHETEVIKHLAEKVRPEALDYRPTPGQRSMLELLRYMTRMAAAPTLYTLSGSWEEAEKLEAGIDSVGLETFATEMDRQMEIVEEALLGLDEAAATDLPAKMPWGSPTTVAAGLMDMSLKTLVAYRMQLFLYLKSSGVTDIGPANCWVGVEMPKPEAGSHPE